MSVCPASGREQPEQHVDGQTSGCSWKERAGQLNSAACCLASSRHSIARPLKNMPALSGASQPRCVGMLARCQTARARSLTSDSLCGFAGHAIDDLADTVQTRPHAIGTRMSMNGCELQRDHVMDYHGQPVCRTLFFFPFFFFFFKKKNCARCASRARLGLARVNARSSRGAHGNTRPFQGGEGAGGAYPESGAPAKIERKSRFTRSLPKTFQPGARRQ